VTAGNCVSLIRKLLNIKASGQPKKLRIEQKTDRGNKKFQTDNNCYKEKLPDREKNEKN
jgi:hypothetical protein